MNASGFLPIVPPAKPNMCKETSILSFDLGFIGPIKLGKKRECIVFVLFFKR